MGSTLKLTRDNFREGMHQVDLVSESGVPYLDGFEIEFPDGINTANALEICRVIQNPTFEGKQKLMRICIADRIVSVKCPNGDVEKFCISNPDDSFDGFELFKKEPLALIAIADAIYGYVLKKSLRLSIAQAEVARKTE